MALGARTTLPAICSILLLQPPSWDCRMKRSLSSFNSDICELYADSKRRRSASRSASWVSKKAVRNFKDLPVSSLDLSSLSNFDFSSCFVFSSLKRKNSR